MDIIQLIKETRNNNIIKPDFWTDEFWAEITDGINEHPELYKYKLLRMYRKYEIDYLTAEIKKGNVIRPSNSSDEHWQGVEKRLEEYPEEEKKQLLYQYNIRKYEEEVKWHDEFGHLFTDDKFTIKYKERGGYYDTPPTPYLHQDDYATRLAKAEKLNGCQFKDARVYKSKRWGEPMAHHYLKDSDKRIEYIGSCDGKNIVMEIGSGFRAALFFIQVVFSFISIMAMFEEGFLIGLGLLVVNLVGIYWIRQKLYFLDVFTFNRHIGLVRTPHQWWRRSFYIPYEDLDCYDGGVVKSVRGGGARGIAKIRARKVPKRFYLFAPQYLLAFGGMSQDTWAKNMAFMNNTIPVSKYLHKSIENYYKRHTNAMLHGAFPEEITPYIDSEDQQVCKKEIW